MMLEEYPELSEITLHGVKQYASFGARDVLILVSKVSGGDVLAKKHGELTQQDRERFSSEGIPEDCWEEDAMLMKARYLKDERYESVNVEDCHEIEKEYVLEMVTSLLKNTSMPGGKKNVYDIPERYIVWQLVMYLWIKYLYTHLSSVSFYNRS